MTGLLNGRLFVDRVSWAIKQAARHANQLAILHINLGQLQRVYETLGPKTSDNVIKQVADRINAMIRGSDLFGHMSVEELDTSGVFRLSGSEFSILCTNVANTESAALAARRVIAAVNEVFDADGTEVQVTPSIGIAGFPVDAKDTSALIKCAVCASAQASQLGGGRFEFFSPNMNEKSLQRLRQEAELRRAIEEQDQLILYFQPKVEVCSGQMTGVEALIRWQKPDGQFVSPENSSRWLKKQI